MEPLWNSLEIACGRTWFGAYLRMLAITYATGAFVHYTSLFGSGKTPSSETPIYRKLSDLYLALLSTVAVYFLWLKSPWGVILFLTAAVSQLILYHSFPHWFAFDEEQKKAIRPLMIFHSATIAILVVLFLIKV